MFPLSYGGMNDPFVKMLCDGVIFQWLGDIDFGWYLVGLCKRWCGY